MGKNQPKHNPPKHNPPPKPPPPPPPPPRPPAPKPAPAPKKADEPKPAKKSEPAHKPAQRQTRKAEPPHRTPNKPGSNKPANNRQDNRQNNKGPKKKHHTRPGKNKGRHRGNRSGGAVTSGGYVPRADDEESEHDGPNATPDSPDTTSSEDGGSESPQRNVIAADPDLLLQRVEGAPIELIEEMLFQAIGSLELITIMRDYSFDGQKIFYQPIENLEAINREYNPQTITNPAFNFSNWKRLHAIDDPSHIIYGSADSEGAVRLEVLPGQVNILVVLPDLSLNQLIEVAVSYSPEGLMYVPGFAGEDLYDGGVAEDEVASVVLDGEDSATVVWDEQIDGGSSQTYYAIIDGGEAISYFTGSVDGGNALGYNIDRTLIGAGA